MLLNVLRPVIKSLSGIQYFQWEEKGREREEEREEGEEKKEGKMEGE